MSTELSLMFVKHPIWEPLLLKTPYAHDCLSIWRHVTAKNTSPMAPFLIHLMDHCFNECMIIGLSKSLLVGNRLVGRFTGLCKSWEAIYCAIIKSIDSMKTDDSSSKEGRHLCGNRLISVCPCCHSHSIWTEQTEKCQACHFKIGVLGRKCWMSCNCLIRM